MTDSGIGTVAVVVAAGSGERLGAEVPKALVPLRGRPLLDHALERLRGSGAVEAAVVVYAPGYEDAFESVCRAHDVAALVPGGATRTASVRAGVDAVTPDAGRIAVHDAARALTPGEVIARTVAAVRGDVVAAAPGLPVADTLKRVADGTRVVETVDRRGLWAVHTPQVVSASVLRVALDRTGDDEATDDLGLVERALEAGAVTGRVVVVEGDALDLKITYPRDLWLVEQLLTPRTTHAGSAT